MNEVEKIDKPQGNGVLPCVTASYLVGVEHILDSEIENFAKENNVTVDQLISDMVDAGWTQGLDSQYQYEYWEASL